MTISATTQGLRMGVATSSSRPTVPFDGQVISETDTDSLKVYNGTSWIGVGGNIAIFNDQQTSGTNGGTFTSGSYVKRTLNSTIVNTISSCTLTSSVISLPAGTYLVFACAPAVNVATHKLRLQNTTAASTIAIGTVAFVNTSTTATHSIINTYFTLASTSNIELQHRCETTAATVGLGAQSGFGDVEVYAQIQIVRIG